MALFHQPPLTAGDVHGRSAEAAEEPQAKKGQGASHAFVPTRQYVDRSLQGWTVKVNRTLLEDRSELGTKALALLDQKLAEIARAVPERACAALRKVPIWLGRGRRPCTVFGVSPERRVAEVPWIQPGQGQGRSRSETPRVSSSGRSTSRRWSSTSWPTPITTGCSASTIPPSWPPTRTAIEDHRYDRVRHKSGKVERAYALTDPHEYFAEGTEAYFGRNDFYPLISRELERHDPELLAILNRVWETDRTRTTSLPVAPEPCRRSGRP